MAEFRYDDTPPRSDQMAALASEVFDGGVGRDVLHDWTIELIASADAYFSVYDDDQLAACGLFNYLQYGSDMVVHAGSVLVAPAYQKTGLAAGIFGLAACEAQPDYLVFQTSSFYSYRAAEKLVDLYPKLDATKIPKDIRAVGRKIAKTIGGRFPVQRGTYGRPLYASRPGAGRPEAAAFYAQFNYAAGDSLLCVGRFP